MYLFYLSIFTISLMLAAIYLCMWHKHFDSNFTVLFTLIPVTCLGYVFYTGAHSVDGAILALQITYIGGCFLQLFILFSIFNLCQIRVKKWIKVFLFMVSSSCYLSVLSIGHASWFYSGVSFRQTNGVGELKRTYGPLHTYLYLVLIVLFLTGVVAIVYSWFKKRQVPQRVLLLLGGADFTCMFSFLVLRKVLPGIDLVPVGLCLSEVLYLFIVKRVNLYDVGNTVIDSVVAQGSGGYITFDFQLRYLGSNEMAKLLLPQLLEMTVDHPFGEGSSLNFILEYIKNFQKDPGKNHDIYTIHKGEEEERIYTVNIRFLYQGKKKCGYIVTFVDDTANKKYISLLANYNESLKKEVDQKTGHILEMQDNLIMSMAMMVESRDNSTGGHIKRTSEGVHLLVEEIQREGILPMTTKFCQDVIKAAPMHDLGKIAVDDAVLRKPGRYIPPEYEIMKRHAEEGARVIHVILLNTDDESFKQVAENVAHYHHERWDGSGYPEGLSGEEIPLEARIMAIADVYDALVSRRVYKEPYDFEKADSIIREGMGSQFDPNLWEPYQKARTRLEEYYKKNAM